MSIEIELVDLRFVNADSPLKGFADLKFKDLDLVVRDWRIIQNEGERCYVASPQNTWKSPNGRINQKTIISMPGSLRQKIELLVLPEFERAKELRKNDGIR